MSFAVGSLVKCRGREWVVLPNPGDDPDIMLLKPLGGQDAESCGVYLPLEPVQPASFGLPDPKDVGDNVSCRLLRDAVRLGFRNSAGPFRSFGKIACEPRPYQLVPLMMALRLDPVRMLIADDVGIGKTVEAALITREMLDRGEVDRLSVLCPPHLAEQWQRELREKFHIEAELVLSGTVGRLERQCGMGQSLFELFPYTVVSTDYIKSSRRREDFLRACPKLVIVDEAHTCASGQAKGGRHYRNELLRSLAKDESRHIILVTATPHSGIEAAFRSLLSLLNPQFTDLPADLNGAANEKYRRQLAAHMIQRRRADIRSYLDADTPFPEREEKEETYKLTPEYRELFNRVLKYVRERVKEGSGNEPKFRQRVRWWAALALLRTLASSPAAAALALRTKAAGLDTQDEEEADEIARRTVMDIDTDDAGDVADTVPGADSDPEDDATSSSEKRRLREMAKLADGLLGDKDAKLAKATAVVKGLLADGHSPIVFCRYIATAEYLAGELRKRLGKVEVDFVTGLLPAEEREQRVEAIGQRKAEGRKIVLVATDCLSEGINLQAHFDAVVHFDLGWAPTRHEQRDGRVDRFGQPKKVVRSVMLYGIDNQIDGIVLEVLIRKHKTIRSSLGISVPVPVNSNSVMEALFEGLLLRESEPGQMIFEEFLKAPATEELHREWTRASEREKQSRTLFAQQSLKPDEVANELAEVRTCMGAADMVARFIKTTVESCGGSAIQRDGLLHCDLTATPRTIRDICGEDRLTVGFALPFDEGVVHVTRTHPLVESLSAHVMDTALDPKTDGLAKRCGVIHTPAVDTRTTLLLLRLRYHIITKRAGSESQLLAEDCRLVGFKGAPEKAEWIEDDAELERLLDSKPGANIDRDRAAGFIQKVVQGYESLRPYLEAYARKRGDEILGSHRRVREATRQVGVRYEVEPQLPVDCLGMYVFLPA